MKKYLSKIMMMTIILVGTVQMEVFAATDKANYGEKFGTWALDQLFWVVMVVLLVAIIGCIVKRNVTGLIVTIVIGVLVVAFFSKPQSVKKMGGTIWEVISGEPAEKQD